MLCFTTCLATAQCRGTVYGISLVYLLFEPLRILCVYNGSISGRLAMPIVVFVIQVLKHLDICC